MKRGSVTHAHFSGDLKRAANNNFLCVLIKISVKWGDGTSEISLVKFGGNILVERAVSIVMSTPVLVQSICADFWQNCTQYGKSLTWHGGGG